MADTVLSVRDLSIEFDVGGIARPAVRDLSFDLSAGEVLGIVGESGSGKSTILFAIMRYLADNARVPNGSIRVGTQELLTLSRRELDHFRGNRIAMIFQDPTGALNPSMRVGDQIAEGILRHQTLTVAEARAKTMSWMARVQLETPKLTYAKFPHELSGGQRQRVMIALALAMEPDVLLMDEPTTALDAVVQAHILELVRTLAVEENLALVFVTHDLAAIAKVADRILVLYAGELMENGPANLVLNNPSHPYTQALLKAMPKLDWSEPALAIPGMISEAVDRFSACVFVDRCAQVKEKCRTTRPKLEPRRNGVVSRCHFQPFKPKLSARPPRVEISIPVKDSSSILQLNNVTLEYPLKGVGLSGFLPWEAKQFQAVRDVSFNVPANGALAIVGESGSGKSTIARAILGLMPVARGTLIFGGEDIAQFSRTRLREFRQMVQIAFQHPTSSLNPRKRILHQVARPVLLAGQTRDAGLQAAEEMLSAVGLNASFHDRMPASLSGGQLQRVAIARAFVSCPKLLILDEPTTALDVSVQAGILELLVELKLNTGCTFLLISHDLAVVRQIAQDILVLKGGVVCETGDIDQVFSNPQHEYTKTLLNAALQV